MSLGFFVVGLCPWVSLLWGHPGGLCCGTISLGVFVLGHLPGCVCFGAISRVSLLFSHLPGVFVVGHLPGVFVVGSVLSFVSEFLFSHCDSCALEFTV